MIHQEGHLFGIVAATDAVHIPEVVDLEGLAQVGNVVSVMDRTEPDYDFEELYERNKDNLLGMFIKKYIDQDVLSPIHRRKVNGSSRANGRKEKN